METRRGFAKAIILAALICVVAAVKTPSLSGWEESVLYNSEEPVSSKMTMKMMKKQRMTAAGKSVHGQAILQIEKKKAITSSKGEKNAKKKSYESSKGRYPVDEQSKGGDKSLTNGKKHKKKMHMKNSSKVSKGNKIFMKTSITSSKKKKSIIKSMKMGLQKSAKGGTPKSSDERSPKKSAKMKMMNSKGTNSFKGNGHGVYPTIVPSLYPSLIPTKSVTLSPTLEDPLQGDSTFSPTTNFPTEILTSEPGALPSSSPTSTATSDPTNNPTSNPTNNPTRNATNSPTRNPTSHPTNNPTSLPTNIPTHGPSRTPTKSPTIEPSFHPSALLSPRVFCFDQNNTTCGPPTWPDLPIDDNQCGGNRNSPIEISSMDFCEPVNYVFNSGTCTFGDLTYAVNEQRISAGYPDSCTAPSVVIGDLTYAVIKWDYSLGTGHTIDDASTVGSIEIHHSLIAGDEFAEPFAIIGIGTLVGEADPFLDRVLFGFMEDYFQDAFVCGVSRDPIFEGIEAPNVIANPYTMLPSEAKFYQYLGSQTTPPCQENVFWNYLNEHATIGPRQDDSLKRLILEWLNTATCRFETVADPETGSTTRPPVEKGSRPVSLAGQCKSS